MTSPIGAISSALSAANPTGAIASNLASNIGSVAGPSATAMNPGVQSSSEDFAAVLSKGLDSLQGMQSKADGLAVQAATGTLTDVHNYTIAATEASLATQLTATIRNKALEAFNDIMRMPA
jgi:flagellar hook-basal body complex protein FliE